MFSRLQELNKEKDPEGFQQRLKKAERHIQFVVRLYRIQVEGGRYSIHEHPAGATSWKLQCIRKLWKESGVQAVMADQCEFGLMSEDKWDRAPAKNPTRFLTNSPHVGEALAARCQNARREAKGQHRHVQLIQGRARAAQVYPQKLCEAMVRGG